MGQQQLPEEIRGLPRQLGGHVVDAAHQHARPFETAKNTLNQKNFCPMKIIVHQRQGLLDNLDVTLYMCSTES